MSIDREQNSDPEENPGEDDAQEYGRKWKFALTAACIVLTLYGLVAGNISEQITLGGLELQLLLHCAVAWAAFTLLTNEWRRRSDVDGGRRLSLFFMITCIAVGGWGGYVTTGGEHGRTGFALARHRERMIDEARPASYTSGSAKRDSALDAMKFPKEEIARVKVFLDSAQESIATIGRGYTKDLQALGWDSVLSAYRIAGDLRLTRSRALIRSAQQLYQTYMKRRDANYDTVRAQLARLEISVNFRKGLLAGLDQVRRESKGDIRWELEEREIRTVDSIITLLERHRGEWEIAENTVMFEDPDNFESHTRLLESLNDILRRKLALQEEL